MGRKIGVIISFITVIVELFSACFFTPLLLRSLGSNEYGIYALVLSITSYLVLLDLGVGNSVVKYMSKFRANRDSESQNKFFGAISVYYYFVSFVVLLAGSIIYVFFPRFFSKGLSSEEIVLAKQLLIIVVLNVSMSIGTSHFFYTVVAFENFIVSKGTTLLVTLIRIVVSIILLLHGAKSLAIATINLISVICIRLVIIVFVKCKMKIKPKYSGIDKALFFEIISFSSFVLLQLIATQMNNMADQILIAIIVPSSSKILGIYGVGAQISQYFQSFGGVLNGVLMPGVVKMVESGASPLLICKEMSRIGRYNLSFLGLIWAVFLVFGRQFISLWSGPEYLEAYFVSILLITPHLIMQTQLIGSQVLWAMNKHKRQAIIKLVVVFVNVFFTVLLIKWNPLKGATIGTFISLLLGDVIAMQYVFAKEIGISLRMYYKSLFSGLGESIAICCFVGYCFSFLNLEGWLGFIVNCLVMCAVYFLALLIFGLNRDEKQIYRERLLSMLKKKA